MRFLFLSSLRSFSFCFLLAFVGYFFPSLVEYMMEGDCMPALERAAGASDMQLLYVGWMQPLPVWVSLLLSTFYLGLILRGLAYLCALSSRMDVLHLGASFMLTICASMLAGSFVWAGASLLGLLFVVMACLLLDVGRRPLALLGSGVALCAACLLLECAVVYFAVLCLLLLICRLSAGFDRWYALSFLAVAGGSSGVMLGIVPELCAQGVFASQFTYDLLLAAICTLNGAWLLALILLLRRRWWPLLSGIVIWPLLFWIFSEWELMSLISLIGLVTCLLWTLAVSRLPLPWSRVMVVVSCLFLLLKFVGAWAYYAFA